MLIPEIDRLLKADEKNAREMHRVFAAFSHDLPELLNNAVTLYTTSSRAFSQSVSDYTRGLPASGVDEATSNELNAKLIRELLLCRIGVLYGIAAADFFRMRITTTFACIRLQCESLALIKLMLDDPAVALEWLKIRTDTQGRTFYQNYQHRIMKVLRSYSLAFSYEQASSLALHSRFPGITFGYRQLNPPDIDNLHNFFSLSTQEFNANEPEDFLGAVIHALLVQAYIFSNLCGAAPEIRDPLLLETRIPHFRAGIHGLIPQFTSRYPHVREQFAEQMTMDSNQSEAGDAAPAPAKKGKRRRGR